MQLFPMTRMSWSLNISLLDGGCALTIGNSTRQQRRIISHFSLLMKCWNDLQTILSFVSLMGILVITNSPSTPMIKARPLSHAPMEPMPIVGCHIVGDHGSFHGWLLHLWKNLRWSLPWEFRQGLATMPQKKTWYLIGKSFISWFVRKLSEGTSSPNEG